MVSTLELTNFISRSLTHFQKSSLHRIFTGSDRNYQFEYVEDATETMKLITLKEKTSNMLIACYVHYKVLYPSMSTLEVNEQPSAYKGINKLTYEFNLEQLKQGWIYISVKDVEKVTSEVINNISNEWRLMVTSIPIKMA